MIEELAKNLCNLFGLDVKVDLGKEPFGDLALLPAEINKISEKTGMKGEEIAAKIYSSFEQLFPGRFSAIKFESGYINFYFSERIYLEELQKILKDSSSYLIEPENFKKTIVFDYSSPNIAKPFSVGHLRSTVIGQANYNIHKTLGYKTIGINHLGDWGTQFGKLIYAIKTWGDKDKIAKNPIEELNSLYVRFHREAETDGKLNEAAREWFRKLEKGDEEALKIWSKCVKWSMEEFEKIYRILNVKIDQVIGESFYKDKLDEIVDELKEKKLLKESEGAQIVELEGMPPALIKKSDGTTLYLTRDLAALKYRIEKYHPAKIIYHVGNDQALHFSQLEAVAQKLGWLKKTKIVFAGHGMMRLAEGKMSTRAGRTVLLADLIEQSKDRALKIIEAKNPNLKEKEKVALQIGISAIKYADLSTNRKSDVIFSFDKFINLSGNSGPYLQYTYARTCSLVGEFEKKYPKAQVKPGFGKEELELVRTIIKVRPLVALAASASAPNILCDFVFKLAEEFNSLYEKKRFITGDKQTSSANIYIVKVVQKVLGQVLKLLGITLLDEI